MYWAEGRLRSSLAASSDREVPDQVRRGGSCTRGVAFQGCHVTLSTGRGRCRDAGRQHLTPVTLRARVQNALAGPADLCRTPTHLLRCGTPDSTDVVPPWVLLSATMAFRLVIPPRPSPCGDHFGAARDQKLRTAEILSNQNVQNFGQIVVPSLGSGTAKLGQRYDRCWKQTTRMYHVMDRGKFQGRHGSGTCSTVVVLRDHLAHLAHHVYVYTIRVYVALDTKFSMCLYTTQPTVLMCNITRL